MTFRSFRPLPCSTWISMRSLSMSPILRLQTSAARKPAPYEMLSAARYFRPGPGAAIRMSDTSSTLNTTGSFRGWVRNCM